MYRILFCILLVADSNEKFQLFKYGQRWACSSADENILIFRKTATFEPRKFAVAVQSSGSVVEQDIAQNVITVVITIVAAHITSTNSAIIFTIFRFYDNGLSQNYNKTPNVTHFYKKTTPPPRKFTNFIRQNYLALTLYRQKLTFWNCSRQKN